MVPDLGGPCHRPGRLHPHRRATRLILRALSCAYCSLGTSSGRSNGCRGSGPHRRPGCVTGTVTIPVPPPALQDIRALQPSQMRLNSTARASRVSIEVHQGPGAPPPTAPGRCILRSSDRPSERAEEICCSDTRRLVDKLWSFCNVLRDDGVSTIDYTEQLTYLLFLKMAHERATRSLKPEKIVPDSCSWQLLLDADGDELEVTYRHMLEELARHPGTLGVIFRKAQNRIQDPAKLKRLIVELIDRENWSASGVDIKGDAYEELLAKGAEDIKSGAGQYFTPRALIAAMVDCIQPSPADTVCDPACGTGGFLLAAHAYAAQDAEDLNPDQRDHLRDGFVHGVELVDGTARLAAMNLLLHGIGKPDGESLVAGRGRPHRRPRQAVLRGAGESTVRTQVQRDDDRRRWPGVQG